MQGWDKVLGNEVRVDYITPNDFFWKMLCAHRKQAIPLLQDLFTKQTILALDPGETTGIAIWGGELESIELFQLETKNIGQAYDDLERIILHRTPHHLRYEDYRVYAWMADTHAWAQLHTPQLIGAIKVLAHRYEIPNSCKLAQHAKKLWSDDILKRCGLYSAGMKHARDASRHLFYYMTNPTDVDG